MKGREGVERLGGGGVLLWGISTLNPDRDSLGFRFYNQPRVCLSP